MSRVDDWEGRTGASWAAEWRRTDRSFSMLTERLLDRIRQVDGRSVLDIGCGAGELSLAIARARPEAKVLGVDISSQLLIAARERASHLGNVAFSLADAASWQPAPGFAPQLLVSRHGVMFFADPQVAFANLAALSAPGASLLFSCFRAKAHNPFFTEVARQLPQLANVVVDDPHAPGPFAFADRERVKAILDAAGWQDVSIEPFDFAMIAGTGTGTDPIEEALGYFSSIGPSARALRDMTGDEHGRTMDRLKELARQHLHDGLVSLRASAWIVSARRP